MKRIEFINYGSLIAACALVLLYTCAKLASSYVIIGMAFLAVISWTNTYMYYTIPKDARRKKKFPHACHPVQVSLYYSAGAIAIFMIQY